MFIKSRRKATTTAFTPLYIHTYSYRGQYLTTLAPNAEHALTLVRSHFGAQVAREAWFVSVNAA